MITMASQNTDCLPSRLFRRGSKKTSKLCATGLCEVNPLVTWGFASQRASKVDFFSMRWRHHVMLFAMQHVIPHIANTVRSTSNRHRSDAKCRSVDPRVSLRKIYQKRCPRKQSSWGQHGTHLGPVGPRWAPCWPHEPCYQDALPEWCDWLINTIPPYLSDVIGW